MILEIDIGNSRIKWRLLDEKSGSSSNLLYAQNQSALYTELLLIPSPIMVRIASVRGGEITEDIEKWVGERWSLPVHIARVSQSLGGVRNQYEHQNRLGVDRWLAMLAAFRKSKGACVVIDSGTAFTIDVLDRHGLHLGGYIVPGLQLMRDSLEQNTRIRLAKRGDSASLELGNSTDSAVNHGTMAVLVSLINKVVSETRTVDANAKIFFAGGDAALLASCAELDDFEIASTLVLDGLAIACPSPGGR